MNDLDLQRGEFAVWNECTYRVHKYSKANEFELYKIDDVQRIKPILRVPASDTSDSFNRLAFCQYRGIEYPPFYIKDDNCYFKRNINQSDDKMCYVSLNNIDEVWIRIYRKTGLSIDTIFINPNFLINKPSCKEYSVEEMANGNYMTSYLEEKKDIGPTIDELSVFYGDRINFQKPDMNMLLVDYFVCTFTIDSITFCLTSDYGIVTISVDNDDGNRYIFEIVDYFNSKCCR